MVSYRYDPDHIAPANAAPRCQHIKMSGHRCGAPARRRRRYCHFRERMLTPNESRIDIVYVEDAASLQDALMQVLRLIHEGSLVNPQDGDPNAPPSGIRSCEELFAILEKKPRPDAAALAKETAVKMGKAAAPNELSS